MQKMLDKWYTHTRIWDSSAYTGVYHKIKHEHNDPEHTNVLPDTWKWIPACVPRDKYEAHANHGYAGRLTGIRKHALESYFSN